MIIFIKFHQFLLKLDQSIIEIVVINFINLNIIHIDIKHIKTDINISMQLKTDQKLNQTN